MKVAIVASECFPFIKTGGLADVIDGLSQALAKQGIDVRVFLPKHKLIKQNASLQFEYLGSQFVKCRDAFDYSGIETLNYQGVQFYFIDNDKYFGERHDKIYGFDDDGVRYGFFSRAVLDCLPFIDFIPDIIHVHDWQASIIPYMLKTEHIHNPLYANIKTMLTIHNIAFQGRFSSKLINKIPLVPSDELFMFKKVNFLKTGIEFSDAISTVSPTYQKEILTPYFGAGLHEILQKNQHKLVGILNGVNYDVFSPEVDKALMYNFDRHDAQGKRLNKQALKHHFGLGNSDRPLIAIVSRLTEQKGLDLIEATIHRMLTRIDADFIVVGSGQRKYEDMFNQTAYNYPNLRCHTKFDEKLANQAIASADFLLMPSRFEPCGLTQLMAYRYGTVPIVHLTGGLMDTITPYNEYEKTGSGFGFHNYTPRDMYHTIKYAVSIYNRNEDMGYLVKNAYDLDYSWAESSKQYIKSYEQIVK